MFHRVSRIDPIAPTRVLHGFLFILLALFVGGLTVLYVNNERAFYFWDYKGYHDRSLELAAYFGALENPSLDDFTSLFEAVRRSTFNDYSYYPAVLPALAAVTWGSRRLVFILSLMLLHTLPFALVIGILATRLIAARPALVFWSGAWVAALIPTLWRPTLRGYPDIGAALLLVAAILVYMRDLERKRWWHLLLVGLLLALAMLFRRHFLYAVASFFIAAACERVALLISEQKRGQGRQTLTKILAGWVRISIILVATMIGLAAFGPYFVGRLLNENFGTLYASYIFSITETINSFTSQYGWLTILAAAAGFAGAFYAGWLRRPAGMFFSLYSAIIVLMWILVVRQIGEHYSLHFAASISAGLVALGWLVFTKRSRALAVLGGALLVANFCIALDPLRLASSLDSGATRLLSAYSPPLVAADYDTLLRLVNDLRLQSPKAVFVAASSVNLNQNILMSADEVARGELASALPILYTPDIDSRDWYPLEQLLDADWVVVGIPFQHTLDEKEQDVVGVVVRAFAEGWPVADDFQRLPDRFNLHNGTAIQLYQRIRPTIITTALRTYQAMADFIGARPLGQTDWLNLTPAARYEAAKIAENQYHITLARARASLPGTPAATVLYLNPVSGQIHITGNVGVNEGCTGASLQIEAVSDLSGQQNIEATAAQTVAVGSLALDLATDAPAHLLLTLIGDPAAPAACDLDITDLMLTTRPV